jgi:hypothetical protein
MAFNGVTGQGVRSPSLDVGSAGGADPDEWPDDPPVGQDGNLGPGTPQVIDFVDPAPPQAPPPWMVPGPGGGTVPGSGGPYGPQPERPPPVAAPPGDPKTSKAPPIVSGLGKEVDELLNKSPYLRDLWAKAKANGWHMEITHDGKSHTDERSKTIFINPANVSAQGAQRPGQLATLVAHEIGHASVSFTPTARANNEEDYVSKNVELRKKYEGEAALVNLIAHEQILAATREDIGIRGGLDDFYLDVYKRLQSDEIGRDEAIHELGELMAAEPQEEDGTTKEEVWEQELRDEWRNSQDPGYFPGQ